MGMITNYFKKKKEDKAYKKARVRIFTKGKNIPKSVDLCSVRFYNIFIR